LETIKRLNNEAVKRHQQKRDARRNTINAELQALINVRAITPKEAAKLYPILCSEIKLPSLYAK